MGRMINLAPRRLERYFITRATFAFAVLLTLAGCHGSSPADPDYTLESIVSFGRGGNSERFRGSGWGHTEQRHTWTEGQHAELRLHIAPTKHPLGIRMRLSGNRKPPELPHQPVEVVVNGHKVAEWQVAGLQDFTAIVPAEVLADRTELKMELRIPRAVSPKTLGYNADPRLLGICVEEMQITKAVLLADIWPHTRAAGRPQQP